MDRAGHQRYLVYLKKHEYFGRGRGRLDLDGFLSLERELATLNRTDPEDRARERDILTALLRD